MLRIRPVLFAVLLVGVTSAPSRAQQDVAMKAMGDELERSMKQLQLEKLDKPYYIAYRVHDRTVSAVSATLGGLTGSRQSRSRTLTVEVRVGDYALDNSNFLSFDFRSAGVVRGFGNSVRLPLENDYREMRRQIWLATDSAYKKALQALAWKRAALQNKTRSDDLPDFSKAEVVNLHEAPTSTGLDLKQAEELVRRLSALFRSMPDIYRSSVELQATDEYTRFLNSEGTEYTRSTPVVGLAALAGAQAVDGLALNDAVTFYERSMAALPGEEQLAAGIRGMGARLVELRAAPLVERYNGPVLVEGQASAEIFSLAFAPRLLASRRPIADEPQIEMVFSRSENPFLDRLGARVLPDWAAVTDDPTQNERKQIPLLGGSAVDAEGVRTRRTVLVENGILKTLLVSRNPARGLLHSTGSDRGLGVSPSNLLFTVRNGLSDADLKKKFLSLVQQRGKPYGIVVRRVQNPFVGDPREVLSSAMSTFMPVLGGARGITRTAVLAYEVFPDGHEQLIRNAELEGLDDASFKDLAAASQRETVHTAPFLALGSAILSLFSFGGAVDPSSPAVVSFVVPDFLFEDVSVKPRPGEIPRPPLSKPPFGN